MTDVETELDNNALSSYVFEFIVLYGSHGILKTYIKRLFAIYYSYY
jgi:hypothetical protein